MWFCWLLRCQYKPQKLLVAGVLLRCTWCDTVLEKDKRSFTRLRIRQFSLIGLNSITKHCTWYPVCKFPIISLTWASLSHLFRCRVSKTELRSVNISRLKSPAVTLHSTWKEDAVFLWKSKRGPLYLERFMISQIAWLIIQHFYKLALEGRWCESAGLFAKMGAIALLHWQTVSGVENASA